MIHLCESESDCHFEDKDREVGHVFSLRIRERGDATKSFFRWFDIGKGTKRRFVDEVGSSAESDLDDLEKAVRAAARIRAKSSGVKLKQLVIEVVAVFVVDPNASFRGRFHFRARNFQDVSSKKKEISDSTAIE